jgi:hypothetical protein
MAEDYQNDPLDDEVDAAVEAASTLVVHAERIGMPELELPVPEDGNVWVVTAKKLGIKGGDGHDEPMGLSPGHDGTI